MGRTGSTGNLILRCRWPDAFESRFDDQLKSFGLLPDREDAKSIFNVKFATPGRHDHRPQAPLAQSPQPFTAAAEVTAGRTGNNVEGYRDYRGVPCIGAWTWLPDRGFAVVTELDLAEAVEPIDAVRWAIRGLLGLLLLASIAIFAYTLAVARLQRKARMRELEIKRLGQYVLGEKIGSGGMGQVYRAITPCSAGRPP